MDPTTPHLGVLPRCRHALPWEWVALLWHPIAGLIARDRRDGRALGHLGARYGFDGPARSAWIDPGADGSGLVEGGAQTGLPVRVSGSPHATASANSSINSSISAGPITACTFDVALHNDALALSFPFVEISSRGGFPRSRPAPRRTARGSSLHAARPFPRRPINKPRPRRDAGSRALRPLQSPVRGRDRVLAPWPEPAPLARKLALRLNHRVP